MTELRLKKDISELAKMVRNSLKAKEFEVKAKASKELLAKKYPEGCWSIIEDTKVSLVEVSGQTKVDRDELTFFINRMRTWEPKDLIKFQKEVDELGAKDFVDKTFCYKTNSYFTTRKSKVKK